MLCSFEKLVLYIDKHLDLDGQLEVLGHPDECDTCFHALYQITRDREKKPQLQKAKRLAG